MGQRKKCSQMESSSAILLRTRSMSDPLNQCQTLCFWWHWHIFTTISFIRTVLFKSMQQPVCFQSYQPFLKSCILSMFPEMPENCPPTFAYGKITKKEDKWETVLISLKVSIAQGTTGHSCPYADRKQCNSLQHLFHNLKNL